MITKIKHIAGYLQHLVANIYQKMKKSDLPKKVNKWGSVIEWKSGGRLAARVLKAVVIPLFLATVLFFYARPSLATFLNDDEKLAEYLASGGEIEAGIEAVDGISKAYYQFDGVKNFFNDHNYNVLQISVKGGYITYSAEVDGSSQIFLYYIPNKRNIQITHNLTNINPIVSKEGRVVWEGWVETRDTSGNLISEGWQLFLYDGKRAQQLTQGKISVNADIEGDYVVFARKEGPSLWRSVAYSIADDSFAIISLGEEAEYPKLDKGDIYYGADVESQKRYPLKVADLFLLDFDSLDIENGDINLEIIEKSLSYFEAEGE